MKNTTTILFFLLFFTTISFAQSTPTWAPLGATWYFRGNSTFTHKAYQVTKDTVFQERLCKQIIGKDYQIDGNIEQIAEIYTYQSEDSIFYYNNNYQSFELLYKFNPAIGDTITLLNPDTTSGASENFLSRVVVDSFGVFPITTGEDLRLIHYTFLNFNGITGGRFIERIGNLLYAFEPDIGVPTTGSNFNCYIDNEVEYHPNEFEECDAWQPNSVTKTNVSATIQVFPTMSQNLVHISISEDFRPHKYQIVNSTGQVIKEDKWLFQNNTLSLENLSKGVYFLHLFNDKFYATQKVIKI